MGLRWGRDARWRSWNEFGEVEREGMMTGAMQSRGSKGQDEQQLGAFG
jgi:hypothetical protein